MLQLAGGRWPQDILPLLALQKEGTSIQTELGTGGDLKHIEISATPVFDRAYNLVATSLTVRDVAIRVQSEATLQITEQLVAVARSNSGFRCRRRQTDIDPRRPCGNRLPAATTAGSTHRTATDCGGGPDGTNP